MLRSTTTYTYITTLDFGWYSQPEVPVGITPMTPRNSGYNRELRRMAVFGSRTRTRPGTRTYSEVNSYLEIGWDDGCEAPIGIASVTP